MLKEPKAVFCVGDKQIGVRFNELLSENLDAETEMVQCGNITNIYVSSVNYQKALKEGREIAEINNWNMSWINAYNEPRPVGYISVMYNFLPKTRVISSLLEALSMSDGNCSDIKEYIDELQKFLGGRNIMVKYNQNDNAIEFLVSGSLKIHELVRKQCEGFCCVTKNSPFIKNIFLREDGYLVKNEEEIKEKESPFRSYFDESAFVDGVLRPQGSNIAPHSDSDDSLKTGYKYTQASYGVRDFTIKNNFVSSLTESIQGSFVIYENKKYNYYWNNEKKEQTYCKEPMPFTMIDNAVFESNISIQDEKTVSISTTFDVTRNIVGYNFDGNSVRDGLFRDFAHEDGQASFQINEYFKIISNGTRLLHYTENSDFFEVYKLPDGWRVEDGISKLCSKVFDDVTFDKEDKDLTEINSILASCKTKSDYTLKLQKDGSNN